MSIVSVNEWDTFLNLFSQNGISDLIRQEIKILRKLYYIEKTQRLNIQLHTKCLTINLPRLDLGDYEIFEEGEEVLCNICYKICRYDKCLKCMCEKLKYDDENIVLTDTERYKINDKYRINHLIWSFYSRLNHRFHTVNFVRIYFNKLSYEDKMDIIASVSDRDLEYMEMGIFGTKYRYDIIPCEDKLNPDEY